MSVDKSISTVIEYVSKLINLSHTVNIKTSTLGLIVFLQCAVFSVLFFFARLLLRLFIELKQKFSSSF